MSVLQVLMTRHTVMVVGQTGGGKSVILQTLARSQTKMGKRTTMNVLNPKVQTISVYKTSAAGCVMDAHVENTAKHKQLLLICGAFDRGPIP